MERRVLLAVCLSFLVLVLYQRWIGPPPGPVDGGALPVERPTVADSREERVESDGIGTGAVAPTGQVQENAETAPVSVATPSVADDQPRDIVVETERLRAVFANRGATLVSWQLKGYTDEDGGPVELVLPGVAPGQALPFTLEIPDDAALTARLAEVLFRPSVDGLVVASDPGTLVFLYEDDTGLRVRKSFTFQPTPEQPYVVVVEASVVTSAGAQPVTLRWGPALGGVRRETSRLVFQQLPGAVLYGRALENGAYGEADVHRALPSDLGPTSVYEGQFAFAGVDNHYFLVVGLGNTAESRVDYRPVAVGNLPHDLVDFALTTTPDSGAFSFFIGPKDFDLLGEVHPDLVRAIDFGWLSVLVVPLHRSLKWIFGFVGNWGWSIIFLTVLINIVIFPLRQKSVASMRKMQELQPEMKAIQARYANLKATDPEKQKMNQEVMELYRRHGANPASGCLPMLLTMPILIAFYRLLSMAVELRGAPFMFWITDLSVQDPLYVTPVVMGASMVFQQKLQPSQADPMQQKVMMFMPIMFTFMFLWAPSGLVIYWLTSNVIGIGQQVMFNRMAGPLPTRQVRPPAERRVTRAVAGATDPENPSGDKFTTNPSGEKFTAGKSVRSSKQPRQGKGSRRARSKNK